MTVAIFYVYIPDQLTVASFSLTSGSGLLRRGAGNIAQVGTGSRRDLGLELSGALDSRAQCPQEKSVQW